MIKSFITYTPEEERERQQLVERSAGVSQMIERAREIQDNHQKAKELMAQATAEYDAITREQIRIMTQARRRYILDLKSDPRRAVANVTEIARAYTKDDFVFQMTPVKDGQEKLIRYLTESLENPKSDTPEIVIRQQKKDLAQARKTIKELCRKTYESAATWLFSACQDEIAALDDYPAEFEEARNIITARAATLYRPRNGSPKIPVAEKQANSLLHGVQLSLFDTPNIPMARSVAADALMLVDPRTLSPDALRGGAAVLKVPDANGAHNHTIFFNDLGKYSSSRGELLGVPTLKLIDAAQAVMTASNPYRPGDLSRINPTVIIDTKEYARANGVRIDAERKDTPEEQRRENEAVKGNLRSFLTTVRGAAQQLVDIGQAWEEVDQKGNTVKYVAARMASSASVSAQYIRLNLDADVARSIMSGHMGQYPTALLALDGRKPVPYRLGKKIANHNSMVKNRTRGTANTLSVEKLLEAAPQIPSYDSIIKSGRKDWKKRICGALESSLDELLEVHFLRSWSYRHKVLGKITIDEARRLKWEEYKKLYIDFELEDESTKPSLLAAKKTEESQKRADKKSRPRKARKES